MRKQRGFSLIEIIVVISIIALLMTMLVVGLQYVSASSKEKSTRITLQNAQNMLAEFETTAGISKLVAGAVDAPADLVSEGGGDRKGAAVRATADDFERLRSIPKNKSAMDQLPAEQLMREAGWPAPVLLDGWNNPILFVRPPYLGGTWNSDPWEDRYGLKEVELDEGSSNVRVVNPGGADIGSRNLYPNAPASDTEFAAQRTRLSHFRPFFVSAGPDGDFRTHDDNLYSFEN